MKKIVSIFIIFLIFTSMLCTNKVYAFPRDNIIYNSSMQQVKGKNLYPGVHNLGSFTFHGENGGSYNTYQGRRVKLKIQFKAIDNNASSHLYIDFVAPNGKGGYEYTHRADLKDWLLPKNSEGYSVYESDWISVNKGVDYRILYSSNSDCACNDERTMNVRVTVEVR